MSSRRNSWSTISYMTTSIPFTTACSCLFRLYLPAPLINHKDKLWIKTYCDLHHKCLVTANYMWQCEEWVMSKPSSWEFLHILFNVITTSTTIYIPCIHWINIHWHLNIRASNIYNSFWCFWWASNIKMYEWWHKKYNKVCVCLMWKEN